MSEIRAYIDKCMKNYVGTTYVFKVQMMDYDNKIKLFLVLRNKENFFYISFNNGKLFFHSDPKIDGLLNNIRSIEYICSSGEGIRFEEFTEIFY